MRIPEYQRPYRWSQEKIEDLLADLKEFFIDKPVRGLDYYIGSILLYNNHKCNGYEIIDGQQRLTTLHLIYYVIHQRFIERQDLIYNTHISYNYIKKNLSYLQNQKELLESLNKLNFFDKLAFTLIISSNEDNSFSFFDSQNNRGVALAADDYLKAYHLREVACENLQAELAKTWEQTAIKSQQKENIEKGLWHLFYKILYRGRAWRGQRSLLPENKDVILSVFQKNTKKSEEPNKYALYPGRFNLKYKELRIDKPDEVQWVKGEDPSISVSNFPFSMRQPLFKGHNFFQFTQKYHAIHQLIFYNEENTSDELKKTQAYYQAIYSNDMSEYLRHYMQLCLVMYYDVFQEDRLSQAIAYFDYFMGSIRIDKSYVRKESIKNSLLNATNNLLDVIATAYTPEEIFDFIAQQETIRQIYDPEKQGKLEKNNGAGSRYTERVLKFYGKHDFSLKDRLSWIN